MPTNPGPSNPGLSGIAQVSMRATDLPRAVRFYTEVLGLELLSEAPGMAFILAGTTRIMLGQPTSAQFDHPGSILYFETKDIDASCEALRNRGVEFIREPFAVHREDSHEFWLAFFPDSEGNTLALSQWRRVRAGG